MNNFHRFQNFFYARSFNEVGKTGKRRTKIENIFGNFLRKVSSAETPSNGSVELNMAAEPTMAAAVDSPIHGSAKE